jgi:DNA-binding FadR family transcriptional regulator
MNRRSLGTSAFQRVLDRLGRGIVGGEFGPGTTVSVEAVMELTSASRSVVREATRVLASLGLLVARQRVGLRVNPSSAWDALNSDVVRWRLESEHRRDQIRELLELRLVVEPAAARSAAQRRTTEDSEALLAAVAALEDAVARRDGSAFFVADSSFHALVITAGGNRMFQRLESVLREALRERTPGAPLAWKSAPVDVERHRRLAEAIGAHDTEAAETLMEAIVREDRLASPRVDSAVPSARPHRQPA